MTETLLRLTRIASLLALAIAPFTTALDAQEPVPTPTGTGEPADTATPAQPPEAQPADTATPAQAAFQMVRGFVSTADRRPARGLVARVKTSGGEQASEVNSDGSFLVIAPMGEGDVEIVVDAADPAKRWYFPSWVSLPSSRAGREQGFVLIPRAWQIPGGRYADEWVEVNLDKAFERISPTRPESFFMWQIDGSIDATNRDRPTSWGLESLPISVLFDRDSSTWTIEPVDSTTLWKVLDSMEEDFGLDLFTPVRAEDVPEDGPRAERTIRIWVQDELGRFVLGMAGSEHTEGAIRRGRVMIRRRRWFRDHVIVKHEFMHALGFGHTCAWPSAVTGPMCYDVALDVASQFDVAHAQLSLNVNALQRRTGARNGIVAAWNGQDRVMNAQVTRTDR